VDGIQAAAERGTEPLPTPDPARVAEIRRAIAAFQSNLEAAVSRRERLVNGAWFRYGEEMGRREEEAAARTEVFAALGIQTSHYQELEALRAIASAVRTVVAADGRLEKSRERLERLAATAEETARWLRQGLEAAAG